MLLFNNFPEVLGHYERFTRLTMVKSTLEFIQGCWADRRGFQGFPGSREYPMFLRRLNGLGDVCGATLFPTVQFDEDASFEDLTTVIAQLEPIVALVNDLFSFYKETGAEEGGLVRNLCRVDGLSVDQALERVLDAVVETVQMLRGVFERRNSEDVLGRVNDWVRGYVRLHLCDQRYRMEELCRLCGG